MAKKKILISRKLPDLIEQRANRDYEAKLNPEDQQYSDEALVAAAEGMHALLVTPTDKLYSDLIAQLPNSVQVIATFSIGTDHIDIQAARGRGIAVTNTPGVLTEATADCTTLLMLGAARRASEGERLVRQRAWQGWKPSLLVGADLNGRRLGIYGMGQIGRAVAHRARALGMEIHYHNRHRLSPELEEGAVYHEEAEGFLKSADVLSLNAPGTPDTKHFLNSRSIAHLPAGAIVVNTARGSLIDDEALIAALQDGRVRAAGLDVYEGEPNIHPGYLDLPNTFLLPHIGSATEDTRVAMGNAALDNIDAVLADRTPPAPVG